MTESERYESCMALFHAGKTGEAAEALRSMLNDFPECALAHNALAAVYKKENNLAAAIESMEKYCLLEPNDPFGYSVLSVFCITAGNHEKAEEALAKASELRFAASFG